MTTPGLERRVLGRSAVLGGLLVLLGAMPLRPDLGPAARIRVESGREYFVAPGGKPHDSGSPQAPLDLATALSQDSPARPGDTIWLRGGRYLGPYVSVLNGVGKAPILVKPYPGERAVIDGSAAPATSTLTVRGSHTTFIGLEITNSHPKRDEERAIGVHVLGPHTRLLNLVIHNTGNGIGLWSTAIDSEIYGAVIFNTGWHEGGRGKGHAIYVQNERGTKRIVDTVLFNGYSFGIHAYTEQGHIDNLHFAGNVSFNNGVLAPDGERKANILVGGWRVAMNPTLTDNVTYFEGPGGRGIELGYYAGCTGAEISNNVLIGGVPIVLRRCDNVSMRGNRIVGRVDDDLAREFPDNAFMPGGDLESSQVFVRPNVYERGRAMITVLNGRRLPRVRVDLSDTRLEKGDRYEVLDAQHYFGRAVTNGVYAPSAASVDLPMGDESAETAQPVGGPRVTHTSRAFGVFIVRRR